MENVNFRFPPAALPGPAAAAFILLTAAFIPLEAAFLLHTNAFIPMTVSFIVMSVPPPWHWRLNANQSRLLHYTREKPIFPLTKPLKSFPSRVTLKTERGNYR